jgi:hypothetical protein
MIVDPSNDRLLHQKPAGDLDPEAVAAAMGRPHQGRTFTAPEIDDGEAIAPLPRPLWVTAAAILSGAYLGAGFAFAAAMMLAIPPLNLIGGAYIALTWPVQFYCSTGDRTCDARGPEWLARRFFTFDLSERQQPYP